MVFRNNPERIIGVGLVGFGYWGANLARNFHLQRNCRLLYICDKRQELFSDITDLYPHAKFTPDIRDVLSDEQVDSVLISTPVSNHFHLARVSLERGKNVFIEKPFTITVKEAKELNKIAEEQGLIIAVDHTFMYSGAVQKIKSLIDSGEIGEIRYIDSVRINLGLFRDDVNVIYDLAPHDLSIGNYLISGRPKTIRAIGIGSDIRDRASGAYLHLEFEGPTFMTIHVNWMSPVKVRRMLIAGTKKMIVYDDTEPSEKVKLYDKGVEFYPDKISGKDTVKVGYRTGDMSAPNIQLREPLDIEAETFLRCVSENTPPISDGRFGQVIVHQLQSSELSLSNGGMLVSL